MLTDELGCCAFIAQQAEQHYHVRETTDGYPGRCLPIVAQQEEDDGFEGEPWEADDDHIDQDEYMKGKYFGLQIL